MKIAVLGLGAYAIALTKVLEKSNEIIMWSKFEEEVKMVNSSRENSAVLPNIKIGENVKVVSKLDECIKDAKIIVIAVPMFAVRGICQDLKELIKDNQLICIVSKGVEKETYMFPSQVLNEELPDIDIAMISGPSFAKELALMAETGFTVASEKVENINKILEAFKTDTLSFDTTHDILGVEICATIKNIYAILLGMLTGMEKSQSTKASTLACIINDARLLLELLGGSRKTAYMYAGLGDLLLTCMSEKSRNFTLGYNLGKGKTVSQALEDMSAKTVEGLHSLESIYKLLELTGNSVKSINLLYDIIYKGEKIDNILNQIR